MSRKKFWSRIARGSFGLLGALAIGGAPVRAQEPGRDELTVEEVVQLALRQNRELGAARQALAGASERVREAWSGVYPSISANASYARNLDVPGQFLPAKFFDPEAPEGEQVLVRFGADNSWNGQLRLEQPLFQATAFIGVGAASRYRMLQAEVVRGQEQAVATRVRQAYYEVLLARESVRLSQESVRRVREALEETRAMQRAGVVGDYDVLRLEVELANLEPALRRAQNALHAAQRTLGVELALEEPGRVAVAGALTELELGGGEVSPDWLGGFGTELAQGAEAVVEQAQRNRSDLRQLRLTENLRVTELRAEQAEYLPKVSLFATYTYFGQADGGINPFGFDDARRTTTPQVGLQVTMPLFGGFSRPARVGQKRATVEQVRSQLDLAEAQVENQVRTLLDQVHEARQRAGAQARARKQAQRGYEIAHAQYREGLGSRLELTDAEVALRQSEFSYAQAVYDFLVARTRLDQAVGRVPGVDPHE